MVNSGKRFLFLLFLFLFLSIHLQAQHQRITDYNRNNWFYYSGDHKIASNWSVHTDFQFRRANYIKDPLQLLARSGVNYHLSESVILTGGYAFAKTYPAGDYPAANITHENRLYEQVQLKSNLSKLEVTHRYRQEQRWIKPIDQDISTLTNRSRYQLRAVLPLAFASTSTSTDAYPYLSASNEIFINFGKEVKRNIFDQNRLAFAVGYKFNKQSGIELGYINQITQKQDGIVFEHNHLLLAGITYSFDFTQNSTSE